MFCLGVILIAGACVSVTSASPPCTCTRNLAPVCGSNGQTFSNLCVLECAQTQDPNLTLAHLGSCENEAPGQCACPFNYIPVCGTDGRTYPNECSLRCQVRVNHDLDLASQGVCPKEQVQVASLPSCKCTREMKRVCGSNGITYSNPCLLNCDSAISGNQIHIEHVGQCDDLKVKVVDQPEVPSCSCTRDLKPVCGMDGVTYNNECLLRCAQQEVKSLGPCL